MLPFRQLRRHMATGPYNNMAYSTRKSRIQPRLDTGSGRHALYGMKKSVLTIRLDQALERQLARAARRSGRGRSELVRDALRRQLALTQLDDLRRRITPRAQARGYLSDRDIFRDVS